VASNRKARLSEARATTHAVAIAATMNPGAAGTGAEMSRKMSQASARSVVIASRVRPEGRRLAVVDR